jgi:CRP-like cAMP-binding protein
MRETKYLNNDMENVQTLMAIPVFKDFEVESLGELLKISKIREYKDGEQIIKEGKHDPWLYFLHTGRVKIVTHGQVLAELRRCGDVFGEMGMIKGNKRSASAYAVGDTTCLATDASRIEEIAGKNKLAFNYILYRIFTEIVTERLRSTTAELIKVKKENAMLKKQGKYAGDLTSLCENVIFEVNSG